jgi:hypothetical protein
VARGRLGLAVGGRLERLSTASLSRGGPNSRCMGPRRVVRGVRRGACLEVASLCTAGELRSGRPEKERRARLMERLSREERDAAEGGVEARGKSKLPAVNGKLAGGGVGETGGLGMDDVCPFTLKCQAYGEV